MGDRCLPRVNRLVAARENEFRFNLHKNQIKKIKCSIDNLPPPTYPHLTSQAKKKQVAIERMAKVERENLYLLEKMRRIMVEPQTDMSEPFMKGSLNREARKREMVKIMNENESLLRRIQSRPPNYNVRSWEREHVDKEKLLANIGEFPYRSKTVSLPPRRGKLQNFGRRALPNVENSPNRPKKEKRGKNDRTCVFSQNNMLIRGVSSTVSVYERLNPFRLEIVALDERCLSTKNAISIKFTDLRNRFESDVELLKPERTDDLVQALLSDLYFVKQGKKLALNYRVGGPSDAQLPKLADPQPTGCTAGGDNYDEEETYDEEPPQVDTGEVSPVRFTVSCKNLPLARTNKGYLCVLMAKTGKEAKFSWVNRTEVASAAKQSPSFSTELVVDMFEKVDRELKLCIYIVDAKKNIPRQKEAKGNTLACEASVGLSQFLALPNGKLQLDLTSNGKKAGQITLVNPDCAQPEKPAENKQKSAKKAQTTPAPAEPAPEPEPEPAKEPSTKTSKAEEPPTEEKAPAEEEPAADAATETAAEERAATAASEAEKAIAGLEDNYDDEEYGEEF